MGFESDSSEFERMSTKKLAILFGLAFVGALFLIQMIQGFPIRDLFRKQITEEVSVITKVGGMCVVEPSDGYPREIRECPYDVGDHLIVSYKNGTLPIESHRPIAN
jgi:hypothetical protein